MTIGKIKLTKEEAEVIKKYLCLADGDVSTIIDTHSQICFEKDVFYANDWNILKTIPPSDFARALLIGYEVEHYRINVGDWAICDHIVSSIRCIGKITRVDKGEFGIIRCWAKWDGSEDESFKPLVVLRKCTVEEILEEKERLGWKSINREIGEFHDKDLGKSTQGMLINDKNVLKLYHKRGILSGFYPAESYVDLSGEE